MTKWGDKISSKWGLQYGVHSGTLLSRDNRYREFDTQEELMEWYIMLEKTRNLNSLRLGHAVLVYPDGKQERLQWGEGIR
jgi:hypothetical protein